MAMMTGSERLVAYPRERFATSAVWDTFVDKHPAGAWWHRQAWLDYSLAYDRKAVELEVPYQSIDDFVSTLRQASPVLNAAFQWPSSKFGIMRGVAVALHHLP